MEPSNFQNTADKRKYKKLCNMLKEIANDNAHSLFALFTGSRVAWTFELTFHFIFFCFVRFKYTQSLLVLILLMHVCRMCLRSFSSHSPNMCEKQSPCRVSRASASQPHSVHSGLGYNGRLYFNSTHLRLRDVWFGAFCQVVSNPHGIWI